MKHFLLVVFLFAPPAFADEAHLPVTLSPQEYDQIINELARRDPLLSLLIGKQAEAQKQAEARKQIKEEQPKP